MKKILYTILTAAAVLLGNYFFSNGTLEATVETPTPIVASTLPAASATSPASNGTEVSYMGTSFTIPFGLANGTQNEIVPQTSPDEPMQIWPAHTKIVLQGYPLQDTPYKPQILIFPADEYQQMSNDPASSEYDARTMISSLQSILSTQKFPLQGYYLPTLPDQHARQIFHAQETILSFKNGNGIRYITEYSQAAFPAFGGGDMLYTFQGLTNDGKYYVSVMMPINLAGLEPMPDSAANPAQYPGYLMKTIRQINQASDQFNPSIESLDALAESLLVGLPATSDMTPSTAEPIALDLSAPKSVQPSPQVTFTLESVSQTDTGPIFYIRLNMENPNPHMVSAVPGNVYVIDSLGQKITLVNNARASGDLSTVYEYIPTAKPADGALTLVVADAYMKYEPPSDTLFTFDVGENPQLGQTWDINQSVNIEGYIVNLASARAITFADIEDNPYIWDPNGGPDYPDGSQGFDNGYQFSFNFDAPVSNVAMDIVSDSCSMSEVRPAPSASMFYIQLCRDGFPKGNVKVILREISILVENVGQVVWKP
jgi:hypothetical protein